MYFTSTSLIEFNPTSSHFSLQSELEFGVRGNLSPRASDMSAHVIHSRGLFRLARKARDCEIGVRGFHRGCGHGPGVTWTPSNRIAPCLKQVRTHLNNRLAAPPFENIFVSIYTYYLG